MLLQSAAKRQMNQTCWHFAKRLVSGKRLQVILVSKPYFMPWVTIFSRFCSLDNWLWRSRNLPKAGSKSSILFAKLGIASMMALDESKGQRPKSPVYLNWKKEHQWYNWGRNQKIRIIRGGSYLWGADNVGQKTAIRQSSVRNVEINCQQRSYVLDAVQKMPQPANFAEIVEGRWNVWKARRRSLKNIERQW